MGGLEHLGIVEEAQQRREKFARFIAPHDRIPVKSHTIDVNVPKGIVERHEGIARPAERPDGDSVVARELQIQNSALREENDRLRALLTVAVSKVAQASKPPPTRPLKGEGNTTRIRTVMRSFVDALNAHGDRIDGKEWTLDYLLTDRRARRYAWPRIVCMLAVRNICVRESLPTIARAFEKADHTTVLQACQRAPAVITADAVLAKVYEHVLAAFEAQQ